MRTPGGGALKTLKNLKKRRKNLKKKKNLKKGRGFWGNMHLSVLSIHFLCHVYFSALECNEFV